MNYKKRFSLIHFHFYDFRYHPIISHSEQLRNVLGNKFPFSVFCVPPNLYSKDFRFIVSQPPFQRFI